VIISTLQPGSLEDNKKMPISKQKTINLIEDTQVGFSNAKTEEAITWMPVG
jgi:hypothetical protein